jgi:phospholipid-binding lipoprotein MlaA
MTGLRSTVCAGALVVALVGAVGPGAAVAKEPVSEDDGQGQGDPLEGLNRKIFAFNDTLDDWVLAPAARGWKRITPAAVRRSVANFFENVRTPIIGANNLLQGKARAGASDVGRFGVNTTVGLLGLFDPATGWGLEKHEEDFGQTLGVWRIPNGPYLVLPLLGPSTVRDTGGAVTDNALSVYPFFVEGLYILIPTGTRLVDVVNYRSGFLDEVEDAKRSAFDYYVFVRDAYLQRRAALVRDEATAVEVEEDLYHPHVEQQPGEESR